MPTWMAQDAEPKDYDQVAPEAMASKVWSKRYQLGGPIEGLFSLVTLGFYCKDGWESAGEDLTYDELAVVGAPLPEERYSIEQWIEFMRCRDPQDPGGTEEWSDELYRPSWFARAEPFPDEQLKVLMERFKPEWIEWDGLPFDDWIPKVTSIEPVEDEDWERMILTPELVAAVREILWQRDDGMNNTEWLAELFEHENCAECEQGADRHTVGPDPLGKRHAWCTTTEETQTNG